MATIDVNNRRKVIPDSMITEDVYSELLSFVCVKLDKVEKPTQGNIIDLLIPLKICNATIAKIVNDVIPNAKATQGSIASLIKSRKTSKSLVDELLNKIEEDVANENF